MRAGMVCAVQAGMVCAGRDGCRGAGMVCAGGSATIALSSVQWKLKVSHGADKCER